MSKALAEIARFQTDRGLHKKEYDALNEHGNVVEELLESLGYNVPKENRPRLKENIELFVAGLRTNKVTEPFEEKDFQESEVVDAYCDIVVFAVGAIMKLGYHPEKALLETAKEINSRKGKMVDGKFEKDLSDEAKAEWYKADYTKAERK